jgi:hypothetical protein
MDWVGLRGESGREQRRYASGERNGQWACLRGAVAGTRRVAADLPGRGLRSLDLLLDASYMVRCYVGCRDLCVVRYVRAQDVVYTAE